MYKFSDIPGFRSLTNQIPRKIFWRRPSENKTDQPFLSRRKSEWGGGEKKPPLFLMPKLRNAKGKKRSTVGKYWQSWDPHISNWYIRHSCKFEGVCLGRTVPWQPVAVYSTVPRAMMVFHTRLMETRGEDLEKWRGEGPRHSVATN